MATVIRKERALPDSLANAPIDPLLPLKIGPTNGREGRQSGLPLMAWGAPGATPEEASCEGRSTRSGASRGYDPADFPYCLH